jgi:hypothetical protein
MTRSRRRWTAQARRPRDARPISTRSWARFRIENRRLPSLDSQVARAIPGAPRFQPHRPQLPHPRRAQQLQNPERQRRPHRTRRSRRLHPPNHQHRRRHLVRALPPHPWRHQHPWQVRRLRPNPPLLYPRPPPHRTHLRNGMSSRPKSKISKAMVRPWSRMSRKHSSQASRRA